MQTKCIKRLKSSQNLIQQNTKETGKKMLNVGSCGFHIPHNIFRKWCTSLEKLFKAYVCQKASNDSSQLKYFSD